MAYDFTGQVVLITGAGSGIGRATALKLSSLGAILALSDINAAGLDETRALSGKDLFSEKIDVSSSQACKAHIDTVMAKFGRLDHILNCAGINPTAYPLEDTTDEYAQRLINVNILGVYNITRAAIPHLKSGASFVNVSSIYGLHPAAHVAIYCATKYAVVGFSKAMALELGPKGIRTNVVAPGFINTPTNVGVMEGADSIKKMEDKTAMRRLGTPEEIADTVSYLFSDQARYMNGSVVEVNGGTG